MFEDLNDQARLVVSIANQEAQQINWQYIGSEHLLLGMLRDQENMAGQALRTGGASFDTARSEMRRHISTGDDGTTDDQITLPLTPRAAEVLEAARTQAAQLGRSILAPEHLLLGMIAIGEGLAVRILIDLGVDLGELAREVVTLIHDRDTEQREFPASD